MGGGPEGVRRLHQAGRARGAHVAAGTQVNCKKIDPRLRGFQYLPSRDESTQPSTSPFYQSCLHIIWYERLQ